MLLLIIGYTLWAIFGVLLAVQDFRYKKVSASPVIGFFIGCFLIFYSERNCCFVPLLIFTTVGIGYFGIKKAQAFGQADYIMIIANSLVIPKDSWANFLISCGLFGILTSLFYRSKKFPMIPAILISVLISKYYYLKK